MAKFMAAGAATQEATSMEQFLSDVRGYIQESVEFIGEVKVLLVLLKYKGTKALVLRKRYNTFFQLNALNLIGSLY